MPSDPGTNDNMNATDLPLLTGKCGEPYPAITAKVAEKAELVLRTFLGKHIPEFVVAETEMRMNLPCQITAMNEAAITGKLFVCKFMFFESDDIIVEGGLVKATNDEKVWIYTCSTAFLDANYEAIKEIIDRAAHEASINKTQG